MMKGRRGVRAVVACARPDDSCSPNPKRRGMKTNSGQNTAITAFFKAVGNNNGIILDTEDIKKPLIETTNGIMFELKAEPDVTRTPKRAPTPVDDEDNKTAAIKNNVALGDFASPPTPHRIELCVEDKHGAKDKSKVAKGRRLYNNQPHIKAEDLKDQNHKLTEYFPVRRSVRKTKKTVLEEKQRSMEQLLRSQTEQGLEVRYFDNKGRGVVAAKDFEKGDFVVEYSGDLIDINEAKKREEKYAQDLSTGCYMYYFKHSDQQYCIDATAESGKLGRLVNHSRNGNLITRTLTVDSRPRLVLIAKDDIKAGEELMYDYGDRSKESLRHHPWLAY